MKLKTRYIFLTLLIGIISTIFVYKYVINESPVYVYDYSGYHEIYKQYNQEFFYSPIKFVKDTISSIRNADYNCSPIIMLIPFYLFFKGSRMGYILGLVIFYVVPVIVLTIFLVRKILCTNEKDLLSTKNTKTFLLFNVLAVFLYTRWWSPTLRGLPDIIAVIPILIVGIITIKKSFIEKQKKSILILIGFLLYLSFMFRRYFIYEIIGTYFALFIVNFIEIFKEEHKKQKLFNIFINFIIAGLTTLICVLTIQLPLIKKILGEDYSQSYSAFQTPIMQHFNNLINEFGYFILFFALIGLIYSIKNKNTRKSGLFCIINIIVCYVLFMRVQAMGVHHYLTISLWIYILFIYGVYAIYKVVPKYIFKIIFLIIISLIMLVNFSTTYILRNVQVPIISQNNKYCKFKYENFSELQRLISDIDKLLTDNYAKFSVLASTENLSDNLLDLLGTEKMKKSVVYSPAIDLRDGLNFNSLMSKYIIVTNIPQTGVSADGQRIISIPNNEIINCMSIGKAYTKISNEYTLQNNIKAYIYRKDRAFTLEEVEEYMSKLEQFYPEWKEKYDKLDRFMLSGESILGEQLGQVSRYKDKTIYFSPGYTQTIYKININKKIKTLKLKLYIIGNINVKDKNCGEVKLEIKKDNTIIYDNCITFKNDQEIELNLVDAENLEFIVDKNKDLNCDWLYMDIENVNYE